MEHGRTGLAGERAARHPRLLRAGHRDLLLPRRRVGAPRGDRLLPPGVPLHDDLLLEPRSPARARPGCGADPARHRPRHVQAAARRRAPRGHGARARAHQPAEEPAAHARRLARAARAASGAVPVRHRAGAGGGGDPLRGVPVGRARQRAVQRGDDLRPDLDPRGLRATAARGDGDRRRGRLHRRPRQPRLLRGRRKLPYAGEPTGRRCARWRGCSPTPRCERAGARASRRPPDYAWERRIDTLEDFFRAVAGARRMALGGEAPTPTGPRRSAAPRG